MGDCPASGPLIGTRQKLLRAAEHISAFENEVRSYAAADPYSIVRQFEDHIPEKSGRAGLTWRVRVNKPPPLRLSVIAGDAIHNLRSALDHLAWALVIANGGVPSSDRPATQFPILQQPQLDEHGNVRPVAVHTKSGAISPTAQTVLDGLQPYGRPQDPLWILRTLSNIDKHRTLATVAYNLGRVAFEFRGVDKTTYARRLDVVDGTLVIWWLQESPDFTEEVEVDTHFSPSVSLHDAPGIGTDPLVPAPMLLARLNEFVRDRVVQRFARTCFGGEISI